MNELVLNLKNLVIIIVVCEFLKNLMVDENYKKYISVSINIVIIAFLILQFKNVDINFDNEFKNYNSQQNNYQNEIKLSYEKNIREKLISKVADRGVVIYDLHTNIDENYNLLDLEIYLKNTENFQNDKLITENIIKELGVKNYEIKRAP